MRCPTCQGFTLLHFDTPHDRSRFQCRGPLAGKSCGWVGEWMTTAEGEAIVDYACLVIRGAAIVMEERFAAWRAAS